jgi:UDP-glucose 4-epimerase
MAVCLVTGGAGFIGSHLVEALIARDHVVRVLDNLTTGQMTNLSQVMDVVELYPGDLADAALVRQVMRGVELVFHLACTAGNLPLDEEAPAQGNGSAVGTLHVLHAALEAHVRRVLYASSLWVYGHGNGHPALEEMALDPQTYAGRVKLSGEEACRVATRLSGLETVRLRFFHVFGPRQRSRGPYADAVSRCLQAMQAGQPVVLAGDGNARRDLIYVEDAVHATLLAAEAPRVAGKVYNVARGRATTDLEVLQSLNRILGQQVEAGFTGVPPLLEAGPIADVRRAEIDLGFCASTDVERGLRNLVEGRLPWQRPPHFGSLPANNRAAI